MQLGIEQSSKRRPLKGKFIAKRNESAYQSGNPGNGKQTIQERFKKSSKWGPNKGIRSRLAAHPAGFDEHK